MFRLHEFILVWKKSINFTIWDTVKFKVQRPDCPYLFLSMPYLIIFNQFLILVNLYQYAKNEAVSSISSREIVDLKVLQSDWLQTFWPISQEQWELCKNTANNKVLIIEQIQGKLMTILFFKFKKTYFWPISLISGAKKVFPKEPGCHAQLHKGF